MERGPAFLFSASSFGDRGCLPFTQTNYNQVEILNMNINKTMTFDVVGERTAAM